VIALTTVDDLLPARVRTALREVLDTLAWAPSADMGFAGRGNTMQLTSQARESKALASLRPVIASAVHQACHDVLPSPDALAASVFPVVLEGSVSDPPHQLPHRDANRQGEYPLLTCVYYLVVDQVVGGELLTLDGRPEDAVGRSWEELRATASAVVTPEEGLAVVMPGGVTHAVAPLTSGRRISVVCNFFERSHHDD